jgi:hypothetical protein
VQRALSAGCTVVAHHVSTATRGPVSAEDRLQTPSDQPRVGAPFFALGPKETLGFQSVLLTPQKNGSGPLTMPVTFFRHA